MGDPGRVGAALSSLHPNQKERRKERRAPAGLGQSKPAPVALATSHESRWAAEGHLFVSSPGAMVSRPRGPSWRSLL